MFKFDEVKFDKKSSEEMDSQHYHNYAIFDTSPSINLTKKRSLVLLSDFTASRVLFWRQARHVTRRMWSMSVTFFPST